MLHAARLNPEYICSSSATSAGQREKLASAILTSVSWREEGKGSSGIANKSALQTAAPSPNSKHVPAAANTVYRTRGGQMKGGRCKDDSIGLATKVGGDGALPSGRPVSSRLVSGREACSKKRVVNSSRDAGPPNKLRQGRAN